MATEVALAPTSLQLRSARTAVFAGSAALVFGMLYGTQIGNCPHPQLALGAHVQFMVAGLIAGMAGLTLQSPALCYLEDSPVLLRVVDAAHWTLLVPSSAEAFAAYKGLGMPLLAERYNIKWEGSDTVFQGLHYGPGVLLMLTWIVILYGTWRAGGRPSKVLGKTL